MIQVSRINGNEFFLNSDLIKTLEATPDTIITLISGEKIMVKESVEKIVESALNYRKRIAQEPPKWT